MMKSRLSWMVISVFLTKKWSTSGDFLVGNKNIRWDQLIIHHRKKTSKYTNESSDCWRVENNLSQTEIQYANLKTSYFNILKQQLTISSKEPMTGSMELPKKKNYYEVDVIIIRKYYEN